MCVKSKVVLTTPLSKVGEVEVLPHLLLTLAQDVSSELHAPAALPPKLSRQAILWSSSDLRQMSGYFNRTTPFQDTEQLNW
jgi:hypothetical protein